MRSRNSSWFVGTVLALVTVAPGIADFQSALAAYESGDFETAYEEWLPLAEQGSPAAQFNIGLLFDRGEGRETDHKRASEWYVRSAENFFGRAQYRLGEMYATGEGVERDLIQARKWFAIAAESKHPGAKKQKKKIAKEMTPGEIALGDMWAREFEKQRKAQRKN